MPLNESRTDTALRLIAQAFDRTRMGGGRAAELESAYQVFLQITGDPAKPARMRKLWNDAVKMTEAAEKTVARAWK